MLIPNHPDAITRQVTKLARHGIKLKYHSPNEVFAKLTNSLENYALGL